jgi:lysozyme family protein
MQVDYAPFVDRMIKMYEGGYGWNRKDPGGPTNYGITCYDLAESEHKKMTSMAAWVEPVKNMTLAQAEAIYRTKYAVGVRFDDLPAGPDVCMLDYGVNSGVARPVHVARAMVGLPPGTMDDALVNAIHKYDAKSFVDAMCAERLRFMHAIDGGKMWLEFGHGWGSRVADLKSYAGHLAIGGQHVTAPAAVDLSQVVTPKATNVPKTAGTATTAATVSTAVAAHTGGLGWGAVAGVAVACVAAGLIYEVYQEQAANAANVAVH